MSESSLAVTAGSGSNLRTDDKTISATTVKQQVVLQGDASRATYTATATAISCATGSKHLMIVQGDGSNYTRIHRIYIATRGAGTAGVLDIRVLRTSTAGTGGTSVNARPFDAADTDPYGGTCMTLPTANGTEGNQLLQRAIPTYAATGSVGSTEWRADDKSKPIIIGTATSNGICLKLVTGIASITVDIEVEFTVSTHL